MESDFYIKKITIDNRHKANIGYLETNRAWDNFGGRTTPKQTV